MDGRRTGLLLLFGALLVAILCLTSVNSVRIVVEDLPEKCQLAKCGATREDKLNVHLVAHTHDDVGWLKTPDQYYYGSRNRIQNAGVQYILDSVIDELIKNRDRKFIYVETAFFSQWWSEQTPDMQAVVRELVTTGQLEFVGGGWVMNDEATTHYSAIIDQMTLGLRWLNDTFGHCAVPRAAWQIDPFGHSREQASLFAQMAFDGLFFSRLDFQERTMRRTERSIEHVWRSSQDLGTTSDLFVSALNEGYGPPKGFDWDLLGGIDEPVIDNPKSEEYNVDEMIGRFVDASLGQARVFQTNHILWAMGEDFNYAQAGTWFKNMDKLIRHVNAKSDRVHVLYSTPSCYLKSLSETNQVFSTKKDDFFPYASDPYAQWTGYFTSRATLKRFERYANNFLQSCKSINVLAQNGDRFVANIRTLQEAQAVMQHHDAVAGTEKQHVAYDYAKKLQEGIDQCKQVFSASLNKLTKTNSGQQHLFCDALNVSSCFPTETYRKTIVTLYNPTAQSLIGHTVRLPIVYDELKYFEVNDYKRKPLSSVIFPIPKWIQELPDREGNATHELLFDVAIPPMGVIQIIVAQTDERRPNSAQLASARPIVEQTFVRSGQRIIVFDKNGTLKSIKFGRQLVNVASDFFYYDGAVGDNEVFENRASGAYIFRPRIQAPRRLAQLEKSILYADWSEKYVEVHQFYEGFVKQVIRVHSEREFIEFDWFVDSIPIDDGVGKEVVARYSSNLNNNQTFFTDSNGRQMLKRVWNKRPSMPNYTVFEPVPSNYYPVNSRIFLRDEERSLQMTVLNDRSQGGSSVNNGQLELMLHRRLLHDDAFGVGEALNETDSDGQGLRVRGSHYLLLDTIENSAKKHRRMAQKLFMQPIVAFQPEMNDALFRLNKLRNIALPENIHLLTLEQIDARQVLLRLEHFFQKDEDSALSKNVLVDLSQLIFFISSKKIENIRELTLGANMDYSALQSRLKFKYHDDGDSFWSEKDELESFLKIWAPTNFTVIMAPMQIRTFLFSFE